MSRKIKKSVSILLALVMLFGVFAAAPFTVHAEGEYTTSDGKGEYALIPDEDDPDMYVLHLISGEFTGTSFQITNNNGGISTWTDDKIDDPSKIKKVQATEDVKFTGSCDFMFNQSFSNCKSMDFSLVDTTNADSMKGMFRKCGALETLDISNFNTEHVKNMSIMFEGDRQLSSLDLSK